MKRVKEDDYSGEFLYLVKRVAGIDAGVCLKIHSRHSAQAPINGTRETGMTVAGPCKGGPVIPVFCCPWHAEI